jgi:hypothetical protein
MRLKFLGHRGHWNLWPEAVAVAFSFVRSFGGRFVAPLVMLLPAARLLLALGVPSI